MRASGVRGLPIYCADYHRSHSIAISADQWPDHLRLSDLEPRFVCKACGKRGAGVRPDFNWKTITLQICSLKTRPQSCSTYRLLCHNCRILSRSTAMRSLSSGNESELSLLMFVPIGSSRRSEADARSCHPSSGSDQVTISARRERI
jgi:hypothetical protein